VGKRIVSGIKSGRVQDIFCKPPAALSRCARAVVAGVFAGGKRPWGRFGLALKETAKQGKK
jgi:hypothetical protein